MLDFANALQEAISGRVDKTGTMAEVNEALHELFVCFTISESHDCHPLFAGILIQPWLRPGVIARPSDSETDPWPALVKADSEPPPLRWLRPEGNVQDSQA